MQLNIPDLSLVVLIGPSGSGKSTFARKHFKPTEVLSSDTCRGLVSEDENSQSATNDAFDVLHFIAAKRLSAGKLTVVDATNVQAESRKPLVALARKHHCLPVAVVLNVPQRVCEERNASRPDRNFGDHVIRQQVQQLRRSLRGLQREGFRHVFVLDTLEHFDAAAIQRVPLWNNRRDEHGPFDIIGDVHGCCDELEELLTNLGYQKDPSPSNDSPWSTPLYAHPQGRKAVFVGDLVDRGPRILDSVRLVKAMIDAGHAICVPGNHDMKLMRKLRGRDVQITHGLDRTLSEIDSIPTTIRPQFEKELAEFLDGLVSHYVFDNGELVVAHAGMKEEMQGRGSGAVREFAMFGETTGETDEFGLPVRHNWAAEYRGRAMVIYGHTPVPEPEWLNRTMNIDTGCVFGGRLTAMRYPERETVSVAARHTYCTPAKPFLPPEDAAPDRPAQHIDDDVLDIDDVIGKRIINTTLAGNVTVREENALAALEVMTRFALDPKWLIYLPPTMAPCETSKLPATLEHPAEAFAYFRHEGVPRLICEEKHMGSRAVVVACRDADAARKRFGTQSDEPAVCFTRTGRRFFTDPAIESEFLTRVRTAIANSGLWDELETDWVCLDCELMPWSAKAQELLQRQYAPVGTAATNALASAVELLNRAAARSPDAGPLLDRYRDRAALASKYIDAYRGYCWPVQSINDLKLAPFHVLATEGAVHASRDHTWHMNWAARLNAADPQIIQATRSLIVDVTDAASEAAGAQWWEDLTATGGEGMVVKPFDFTARARRGIVQPAVKCRGREYLRIIYGPEYSLPENLDRLRSRGLAAKRALAIREFALGIEALHRFTRREPLRRIHECVFAVLALESEPIDPRL